ncbi:MAG: nucleoside permease nupX [Deltaproteobacteria bacterium]|nr:nucleoside permease nupX [Deltaproteobacteria bacterium]
MAFLAWAAGGFRRPVPWRTVLTAGGLMLVLGAVVFWIPWTRTALIWINDAVITILRAGNEGARFLFGPLALNPGETTAGGSPSIGFILAAQVFPAVVFFASLMAALYHLRILQPVVKLFAILFHRTMKLSGAESLAGSSNIFIGVESAMTVRPYLDRMTRSELLTLITCGMATVASTTLALYVLFLKDSFPLIAGHLVSASVMSIPAAALVSKLILPEGETPDTLGGVPPMAESGRKQNTMAALMDGSWEGLKLAAGIGTLLVAILGFVALIDYGLLKLTAPLSDALAGPVDLRRILGWIFTPLAWLLGLAETDLTAAGRLLGGRAILTEVVAYQELGRLAADGAISPRGILVLSYTLCGFAHVASMGIFIGGIGALAPARRGDLSALGLRALVGATLATLMTGAVAGFYYYGQQGLLGM